MNQSINTDSKNSKEPQQKYRLGTVSIKILGGLNRFYGHPIFTGITELTRRSLHGEVSVMTKCLAKNR